MIIGIIVMSLILEVLFLGIMCWADYNYEDKLKTASCFLTILFIVVFIGTFIFGCFHGFVNHPKTEGTHQGVITAIDLEGVYFRRYEVYLKSSGYTTQSDETVYKIYDYETELAQQLKDCIGKQVKLNYGHDGGYIGWKSCGTYHIKSVEIIGE